MSEINLTPIQNKMFYFINKYRSKQSFKLINPVGGASKFNRDGVITKHLIYPTNISEDSEKYAWLIDEIKQNGHNGMVLSSEYFPMEPMKIGALNLHGGKLYWSAYVIRPDEPLPEEEFLIWDEKDL